jgi:membrane protease YdiL (CAAX protease family)
MNNNGSGRPLIKQGWLRALLYIIALIVLSGIVLIIYILGLHKGNLDASAMQSLVKGDNLLIFTFFLFVLTLLITYVFRRWIDRKTIISLGLNFNGYASDAIAGVGLAVFIMGASSLLLKATGHLKWMDFILDPRALFLAFGSIVLVGFYEELIFRGYILNNLMDSFPKWLALLISALLFAVLHGSFIGLFSLINGLIMGLILGLNYIYTRNLWFSICFHIVWKFMEAPVLGFSGNDSFQTLLQTELNGDINITGGANGLEGSVILMAVALLSALVFCLFLQKKLSPRSQPVPGRI